MLRARARAAPALLALVLLAAPALAASTAPVAVIQPVPVQECLAGGARVMLDGSRSFDPDGEPVALQWSAPGIAFDNPRSSMPAATFPLGQTPVTLTATDDGGLSGSATAQVRVADAAPPMTTAALAGTAGAAGWWRSAVTATLSATDGCGVAATYRAVDGAGFAAGTTATLAGDGRHTLEHYSTDLGGNAERVRFQVVAIDATPPALAILDPRPDHVYVTQGPVRLRAEAAAVGFGSALLVGGVEVRADAADATSGVVRVEFLVDGVLRAVDTAPPWAWHWDASADAAGTHMLLVQAVDAAGNQASAEAVVYNLPPGPAAMGALGIACALPDLDLPCAVLGA